MTGLIEIRSACLRIGNPARMARGPLPWDPSDTRGSDADRPSCLPHRHALALAYPLARGLLALEPVHKRVDGADVREINFWSRK